MLDQCRGTAGRSAADVARMFAYADAEASGTVQFAELLACRAQLHARNVKRESRRVAHIVRCERPNEHQPIMAH
jgi:hypothetical protein